MFDFKRSILLSRINLNIKNSKIKEVNLIIIIIIIIII